jgi:cation:H+ antiporter
MGMRRIAVGEAFCGCNVQNGGIPVDSLAVSVPIFLASGLVVVIAGVFLARYGDEIADKTGWGALWVGTILVSVATSLPELVTNISAVVREDAPELALGNVFGADMINIFTVSIVALLFGVRNLFGDQPKDTQVLILVSVGLGILAIALGAVGDYALGWTSVGGLVMLIGYFGGMKLVYDTGRSEANAQIVEGETGEAGGSIRAARSAFMWFGLASLAIIGTAPLLAASANGIAESTGLGAGFMGILAVSIVTTLPEASVTIAAARRRSYGLVLGNIYGSCAFNLSVIFYADLGNEEALLNFMDTEHFVAAGVAILLMAAGFGILRSYKTQAIAWVRHSVYVIPPVYVAALLWVFVLSSGG